MKKLLLLGTNYYQSDVVKKAKELGYETHLFGIGIGGPIQQYLGTAAVQYADHYYPISIYNHEKILEEAKKINPCGVLSIAADIIVPTWNYVAENLGLICNGISTSMVTTNKAVMKKRFMEKQIPTADSMLVGKDFDGGLIESVMHYPLIVKAIDRAGKYGITKVNSKEELPKAISYAFEDSYSSNRILIEEFIDGKEFSAECISFNGKHTLLTFTEKWSGPPHFVEEMHLQPVSTFSEAKVEVLKKIIFSALDALEIKFGASHTEFKINSRGEINIIEIGARMSAENMWDLVEITTGIDYIKAAIDIAVGNTPDLTFKPTGKYAFIKYLMSEKDFEHFEKVKDKAHSVSYLVEPFDNREITKNQHRYGFFIMRCESRDEALTLSGVHHV